MPADTDTLLKDLKTHAEGDATLLAAFGTLYLDHQPSNTALPYWIVTNFQPSDVDDAFGHGYIEEYSVQFQMFHTAMATLASLHNTLNERFDRASISATSGTIIASRRIASHRTGTGLVSKDNLPVYHAFSRFLVKVNKLRA